MPMVDRLRALPVSKLILLVTVLVALLPISILGYHIYNSAWENSWREIREKHKNSSHYEMFFSNLTPI